MEQSGSKKEKEILAKRNLQNKNDTIDYKKNQKMKSRKQQQRLNRKLGRNWEVIFCIFWPTNNK